MLSWASEMRVTAFPKLTGPDKPHPMAGAPASLFLAAAATCTDTQVWFRQPTTG